MNRTWRIRLTAAVLALSGASLALVPGARADTMGDERYWVCVAVDQPVDRSVCQGNPVPGGVHLPPPPSLPDPPRLVNL